MSSPAGRTVASNWSQSKLDWLDKTTFAAAYVHARATPSISSALQVCFAEENDNDLENHSETVFGGFIIIFLSASERSCCSKNRCLR